MKIGYRYAAPRRQHGLTIQGLLIALVIIGVVIFVGLRLFPLYSEKFRVDGILESIAYGGSDAENLNSTQIYKRFLRNANIEGITRFDKTNIKNYLILNKPKRKNDPKTITMSYELRGPMVRDLDVVLIYNRTLELGGEKE